MKPTRTKRLREASGKKPGGQPGHPGDNIAELSFDDPSEQLKLTRFTQPALLAFLVSPGAVGLTGTVLRVCGLNMLGA